MRAVFCFAASILAVSIILAGSQVAAAGTMTLISPDAPAPIIVIGAEPAASERYAAEQMATYLEKMTGRKIEVVDDRYELAPRFNHGKLIAIGRSKLTASIDTTGLGCEQYIMDVRPNMIAIIGGSRPASPGQPARDAGTLYGVYDFLEGLDVRWYRPEPWGEHVPKTLEISIETGKKVSPKPPYMMRATLSGGMSYAREETYEETMQARTWAARNRLNAGFTDEARWPGRVAKFGGMEKHAVGDHSHTATIPPSEYFDSHPEYYALVDGERVTYDLCLGNTDVQRLFADKLIAKAKANPYISSLSAEPNDARGGSCQCPLCKALDMPKNTRVHGQWSNRVAAFGNAVARMVAKEAPWLKVQWLGYSTHTSAPTNISQLEPNTIIMLAPINSWDDWTKKLMDSSSAGNSRFVQTAKDWAALKPSCLMGYQYWEGYGWPGPIPVARVVADRMRNYRTLGIKGMYNESVVSWGPQGLDYYMVARLMWNPDLDVDEELDLYYKNYYGPAETPMKAYHERLMNALQTAKRGVTSGGRGMHLIFTPVLVKELGDYMSEAQASVKGQPLYERRLYGVWAGYEFSRRISEMLTLKKNTGVLTDAGNAGSYYKSAEAEDAYRDLVRWMRSVSSDDAVFDMAANFKDDAAEIIFPKRGLSFGSVFLHVLPGDVLKTSYYQGPGEEVVLEGF